MKSFYNFLVDSYVFEMKIVQNLQEKGGNVVLTPAVSVSNGSFSGVDGFGIASADAPVRPNAPKTATKDLNKIRPDLIKAIRTGKKNGTIREDEKGNIKFVSINNKDHNTPHSAHHETLSHIKKIVAKVDTKNILTKRYTGSSVEVFDEFIKGNKMAFDQKKGKVYLKHKGKMVDILSLAKSKLPRMKNLKTSFDPNSKQSVRDVIRFINSYVVLPTLLMRNGVKSNNTSRIDPNDAPPAQPLDPPSGRTTYQTIDPQGNDPGMEPGDDIPAPDPPFDFPAEWGDPVWNGEYWYFPNGPDGVPTTIIPIDYDGDGVPDSYIQDGQEYDWPDDNDPATIDDYFEEEVGMTLQEFLEWLSNIDFGVVGDPIFSGDGYVIIPGIDIDGDGYYGPSYYIPIEDLGDVFGNPPTAPPTQDLDPYEVNPDGNIYDQDGDGILDTTNDEWDAEDDGYIDDNSDQEGGQDGWWVPIMFDPDLWVWDL